MGERLIRDGSDFTVTLVPHYADLKRFGRSRRALNILGKVQSGEQQGSGDLERPVPVYRKIHDIPDGLVGVACRNPTFAYINPPDQHCSIWTLSVKFERRDARWGPYVRLAFPREEALVDPAQYCISDLKTSAYILTVNLPIETAC